MHRIKYLLTAMLLGVAACIMTANETPAVKVEKDIFRQQINADGSITFFYDHNTDATVYEMNVTPGLHFSAEFKALTLSIPGRSKAEALLGTSCDIVSTNAKEVYQSAVIKGGTELFTIKPTLLSHTSVSASAETQKLESFGSLLTGLWHSTGLYDICMQTSSHFTKTWHLGLGKLLMIFIGILLIGLAIFKGFEPLLLLPIGFGAILSNIPLAGIAGPAGLLGMTYNVGIATGVFPLIIFLGVGAMTDFGPLIANPKTALLGAAAQVGIFGALLGALVLTVCTGDVISFSLKDAASIGIIGGADGPTAIWLTSKLSPRLLGAIAVAAYSYMALVPIIQPPIMRALTTDKERRVRMSQLRHVSKLEKICFPIIITLLCALILPSAAPLIGMLMLGNLMKESGVVTRLVDTASNALMNTVTIFLGLCVGSKLSADQFLNLETIGILILGCCAFAVSTAGGVILGKVMCVLSGYKINPLIGSAGVSAVPMAARVSNKVGQEYDPHNFLLMHAMGPNVAGVIGSAVAAGVLFEALGH